MPLWLVAGCEHGKDPSRFQGTWSRSSGTIDGTCSDEATRSWALPPTITLRAGDTSELAATWFDCTLRLEVYASEPTAKSKQICSWIDWSTDGATIQEVAIEKETIDNWTLTPSRDAPTQALVLDGADRLYVESNVEGTYVCDRTLTGVYLKTQP